MPLPPLSVHKHPKCSQKLWLLHPLLPLDCQHASRAWHLKSNLLCFPLTSGTNSPEEPSAKEASIPPRLPSVLVLGLSLPLLTGRLLSEVLWQCPFAEGNYAIFLAWPSSTVSSTCSSYQPSFMEVTFREIHLCVLSELSPVWPDWLRAHIDSMVHSPMHPASFPWV